VEPLLFYQDWQKTFFAECFVLPEGRQNVTSSHAILFTLYTILLESTREVVEILLTEGSLQTPNRGVGVHLL
jgi:hypothetical protein